MQRKCKNIDCYNFLNKNQKSYCSRKCQSKCVNKNRSPWNKGLTKENDLRIKKLAENFEKNYICAEETKIKLRRKRRRVIKNEIWRKNISNSLKGKKHTPQRRQNERLARIKNIEKNGQIISIGKNETQLLNAQEIKDNCKIERQYRINELGYIVDGYCKETNIVYEVYEKEHYLKESKIQKDLQRQKEIEDFLNCKFIIIKD